MMQNLSYTSWPAYVIHDMKNQHVASRYPKRPNLAFCEPGINDLLPLAANFLNLEWEEHIKQNIKGNV